MAIFLGIFFGVLMMLAGAGLGLTLAPAMAILTGLGGFALGAYIGANLGRAVGLVDKVASLETRLDQMQYTLKALKRQAEKTEPSAAKQEAAASASKEEKIQALETRLEEVQADLDAAQAEKTEPASRYAMDVPYPIREEEAPLAYEKAAIPPAEETAETPAKPEAPEKTEPVVAPPPVPPRPAARPRPSFEQAAAGSPAHVVEQGADFIGEFIRNFFTTGNVVARIGVIVLIFGVAFLLKYATTRYHIAIEYRFIAVAIFAMGLTGLGFRLRASKRVFALILQGGGIGILYMTVYFAAKPYELIPLAMAFGLMVVLVGLMGAVAVFQDARATAVMGMIGGFLAPLLTSSGAGQHVILFSYYAILGLGILGVAWYKSWRELNLLGFLFTFGVATLWGANNYRPGLFPSTEPFLIIFFVFYETIAVLYALRQPLHLRGFVDGTLVFGTPIVAFALQAVVIRHIEYGLAYSALGASVFYLILTKALWRRQIPGLQVLTESFLSLCVVFVSLAIPLGLSGKWTSAVYAFEGAGLVYIGLRQNRVLARSFGLLLQLGAGLFLLDNLHPIKDMMPVINSNCLGFAFVALGGLFSSYFHYRAQDRVSDIEKPLHFVFLVWGVIWWMAGGLREAELNVPHTMDYWEAVSYTANIALLFVTGTALAMHALIKELDWKAMGYALLCYAPCLVLFFWLGLNKNAFYHGNPMAKLGWASWPLALASAYFILKVYENEAPKNVSKVWHAIGFWLVTLLIATQSAWGLQTLVKGAKVWPFIAWGLIPGLFAAVLVIRKDTLGWPVSWDRKFYNGTVAGPILAFCLIWCVGAIVNHGSPSPLPYIPLVNPLELTQAFVLLILFKAASDFEKAPWKITDDQGFKILSYGLLGLLVFIASTAVLARTVHFYADVRFHRLGSSMLFQMALSLFWTLWAVGLTGAGSKKGWRIVWFAGAGLIGVVTVKLFFVDLSHSGALWRVVSFLGAGVLFLIIGYTAPLPPQKSEG